MKLETLAQKSYFSNQLKKHTPQQSKFEDFTNELRKLLESVDVKESEGHNETLIKKFLDESFYKKTNHINKKDRKDYVIHSGIDNTSNVDVILEIKKPNSDQMISEEKPNRKALQQLVLYYFRERIDANNTDIKNLIATDVYRWFIFDATEFERAFYKNKSLVKQYKDWRDKNKTFSDTGTFYNEIAKPFIDELESLKCVYFDIRDYKKYLDKTDDKSQLQIRILYKLFSPKFLLKESFADDSNKLDKDFYNELLHIIGLEEVKQKNKLLIERKPADKRDSGSLLELAIAKLETEYTRFSLNNHKKLQEFGETKDERIFAIALELCITWINRILFLKLLEAQLVHYHRGDKDYLFLNSRTIAGFNELYKLFHNVLAVKINDRKPPELKEKYFRIPYLNSSLFDFADVENITIQIDKLDENATIKFIGGTILETEAKKADGLKTLEYLFKFLDKYDFATVETKVVREEDRKLINASILGKVFEKINGYKDGAVFTPAFITMYMCRQAIRLAVLQKFRDETDFDSDDFDELKTYIGKPYKKEDIKKHNEIIDGLKLCDPAVGSGHFLVSALNEIIAIKSELQILADAEGNPVRDYKIAVVEDELDIRNENTDEVFKYEITNGRPNDNAQFIQKTLFHEKQKLIENCLFGVDINPNSVKICRLRLWIELLKNAYYRPEENYTDLETLPNIDINIKEGNSLISRFSLDEDLKKALKDTDYTFEDYRNKVKQYKSELDREQKSELLEIFKQIKEAFKTELYKHNPIVKKLLKKEQNLFDLTSPALFDKYSEGEREVKARILNKEIDNLKAEIEAIKNNKIYRNAFEWRFEFPEVLDNDGKFLGFDVVIANPPYIRQEELGNTKDYYKDKYEVFSSGGDLFSYFYELGFSILKEKAEFAFINNTFDKTKAGKTLRDFVVNKFNFRKYVDFTSVVVFDEVTTYPIIFIAEKENTQSTFNFFKYEKETFEDKTLINDNTNFSKIKQQSLKSNAWNFLNESETNLLEKINSHKSIFEIYGKSYRGIITGLNEAFITEEILDNNEVAKNVFEGKDLSKWFTPNIEKQMIVFESKSTKKEFGDLSESEAFEKMQIEFPQIMNHLQPFEERAKKRYDKGDYWWELRNCAYYDLFEKPKLIFPNLQNSNKFAFDETGAYINAPAVFLPTDDKYLLAVLNSKVVWHFLKSICVVRSGGYIEVKPQYFEQIPIPEISPEAQEPFIKLVDEILEKKKRGEATSCLENKQDGSEINKCNKDNRCLECKIDEMVYELYELTDAEIEIVEGKD